MVNTSDDKARTSHSEALVWFVRMNSGDVTAAEKAEHASWMAVDPANAAEYHALGTIWSDLDGVTDPRNKKIQQIPAQTPLPSRRAFLYGGAAIAASLGVLFIAQPDFLTSDYATATGELRSVTLSDGTTVDLDADTALAVNYTDQVRKVQLLRGRAFFDVAKDTARPFSVMAAGGSITALGTRFVVHEWASEVTVWVEESAVSVVAPEQSQRVINAAQLTTFNAAGFGPINAADVSAEGAWKRGKLIFEDRPLRQVLADVNRYRRGTIRATDSTLLNMRVSGIFDIKKPDGVLDAIRNTLPVRTTELTRYLVLLSPA